MTAEQLDVLATAKRYLQSVAQQIGELLDQDPSSKAVLAEVIPLEQQVGTCWRALVALENDIDAGRTKP